MMTDEMSLIMLVAAVALFPLLYQLIAARYFQPQRSKPRRRRGNPMSEI